MTLSITKLSTFFSMSHDYVICDSDSDSDR